MGERGVCVIKSLWILRVRWPVDCLSASSETVSSLSALSSSAVFDLVFSLPVLKKERRRALFHVGAVTTWDTVSGLLHGWSTCSSTHRVSSSSVGSFSLPNFSDLNSKAGTAQKLPGMWSSYYLVLKLSSYTSAAHVMKVDSYTNNLDQQLPTWQKQVSDLYQLGRGWAII